MRFCLEQLLAFRVVDVGTSGPAPNRCGDAIARKASQGVEHKDAKGRAHTMAKKVVAALGADDYAALDATLSKVGWEELSDLSREMFGTLRASFKDAGIDLAASKIVRVEPSGSDIEIVEVFLTHGGRGFHFHFHFNVMTIGGTYDDMGHAQWFVWDDEDSGDKLRPPAGA